MKRFTLITACATVTCMFPVAAQAATATGTRVFVEEGVQGLPDSYALVVRFDGAPGEASDVAVTTTGDQVVFEDVRGEIEARGHCSRTEPSRVVCSSGDDALGRIRVVLGDGDDQLRLESERNFHLVKVSGGPGTDILAGAQHSERLDAGPGDDLVDGGAGSDTIIGGAGSDELRGGEPATDFEFDFIRDGERDSEAASDTFIATDGQAGVSYGSRSERVVVDLPAGVAGTEGEQDTLVGISRVVGGNGPDIMLATDAGASLLGGFGNDRIEGGGSADSLSGQGGRDRVFGGGGGDHLFDNSDNARDIQACGPGDDLVGSSDKRDRLRPDCEEASWLHSRRADASRITVQPEISRRRAVFRLTCASSEGCHGRITLVTPGRRLRLGRGPIDIDRARNAERRHDVVVRLNARGREYLRRGGLVRVVIFGSGLPCQGCLNPRPVKTGFTTRMKR